MTQPKFLKCGETAISVEFGNIIDNEINAQVHALDKIMNENRIEGVVETIPTFRSLCVYYNPVMISGNNLEKKISKLISQIKTQDTKAKRVIHIPVCYGGKYGEDIGIVCEHTDLRRREVIRLHTEPEYLVYMLGFLPGFAYLGGMNPVLNTPRLQNPRTKIPRGAVGIGGEQTGIYPLESPGGWNLIGTTPVLPYDKNRTPPILFSAGDYIKFFSITRDEFEEISRQVKNGTYECEVTGGAE